MRWTVFAVLLIAWLHRPAVASPRSQDRAHHDRDGATTASADSHANTPWIDLGPSKLLTDLDRDDPKPRRKRRLAASLTLAGLYGGFTAWTYFAWYHNHQRNQDRPRACIAQITGGTCDAPPAFEWGGDRLFESNTYAGGADKLGHGWATMGLARGGTELLHQWGGLDMLPASAIACGLSELLFFGIELKDGAFYEFSYGDFWFNTAGAAFSFVASNWPRFDELFDFRVQYYPSKAYRDQLTSDGNVNVAEDYTGQTYLLAFHLGGIHALRDSKYGGWSRYVDLAIGFETRGYKPDQLDGQNDFLHTQKLFLGVTLNAQGLFDRLLRGRSARKVTHGLFEVFNIPYTTLPVVDTSRNAMNVDIGGA